MHPGMIDASRRSRLAKYLNQEDLNYFNKNVQPVMERVYETLQGQGRVPPYMPFQDAMGSILERKCREENIIYGDPRAFVYPEYIKAHKDNGPEAVSTLFEERMKSFTQDHYTRLGKYYLQDVEQLASIGRKIYELQNPGIWTNLRMAFRDKEREIAILTRDAQEPLRNVIGCNAGERGSFGSDQVVAVAKNITTIRKQISGCMQQPQPQPVTP